MPPPSLYPLLMAPAFKPRVWGARSLAPIYSQQFDDLIGEVWLTADECHVSNGPLAGKTLGELCKQFGTDLVGESAPAKDRFPLLIKFLFPREKLSIQVHPDDAMARRLGQPCGKTECWYVLAAEPGAQVGLGLKPGITKTDFEHAIKAGAAEQSLNWIDIQPGELIYVPAGTVHAIGPGSILVETQQNSDTTFRLYDYGRPRDLHLELGLQAIRETDAGKVEPWITHENLVVLVWSPQFMIARHRFGPTADTSMSRFLGEVKIGGSVVGVGTRKLEVVVYVDGAGICEGEDSGRVVFQAGEALVLPEALDSYTIYSERDSEFLSMQLPQTGQIFEPTIIKAP